MERNDSKVEDLLMMHDGSVVLVRTVFIILFLIISLVGNSLALFILVLAGQRNRNPFNAYLISMSTYGLLECSLNISLATGFSLEGKWLFGEFLERFNACFVQLQCIGLLLTISAMAIDRYIAVVNSRKYLTESRIHQANYIVLYTWFHAFIFSLPLLFENKTLGLIVRSFIERNICGLSENTSIIYSIFVMVTCYCIPITITVLFFGIIFAKSKQEKASVNGLNNAAYANYCIQESQLLSHARTTKFIVILFILFLVLKIPYVTIDFMTQFGFKGAYIPVNITVNNSSSKIEKLETVDGRQFYYQTLLAWLSFCFSGVYPILMFSWFKEHRKRLQKNCCCVNAQNKKIKVNKKGKSLPLYHSYVNNNGNHGVHSFRTNNMSNNNKNFKQKNIQIKKNKSFTKKVKLKLNISKPSSSKVSNYNKSKESPLGFRVPVLYAAADGLHVVASQKSAARTSTSSTNHLSVPNGQSQYAGSMQDSELGCSVRSAYSMGPLDKQDEEKQSKNIPNGIFKRLRKGATVTTENDKKRVIETRCTLSRPSSVVDTRLDVDGSVKNIQSDDESYFQCFTSDIDDDYATDSELSVSANSRTLILPYNDQYKCKIENRYTNSNLKSYLPLPHTPTPVDNSIHDKNNQNLLSQENLKIHDEVNPNLANNMYKSTSNLSKS